MSGALILNALGGLGWLGLLTLLLRGMWRPDTLNDREPRHRDATLDELLDGRDIDGWRADLDAERPEGCCCLWPPRGSEHSMIRSAKCDVHPPIRGGTP